MKIKNLAYTGGTDGVIVVPGHGPLSVQPGTVIRPDSLAHAEAMTKTGHFEETSKAATGEPALADAPAATDEVPA